MKNSRFVLGLLLGVILCTALFFVVTCKSEPVVVTLPQSSTEIKLQQNYKYFAYKLNVDNSQYIVVVGNDGGVSIVKHK